MSIQSEIERISGNVANAYTAASEMGATMPDDQNSDNLESTIRSIQAGEAMSIETIREICGWQMNGLPVGYTLLEYIESSGAQYINTGYVPNSNTRIVIDVQLTNISSDGTLFGARTAAYSNSVVMIITSAGRMLSDYGTERLYFTTYPSTSRVQIDYNKNATSALGETLTFTAQTFKAPSTLYLLARNNNGTTQGIAVAAKLYSCQIYDNGNLVRDFVPCVNANGVYGLYDKVNSKFYSNAGSGSFTGA